MIFAKANQRQELNLENTVFVYGVYLETRILASNDTCRKRATTHGKSMDVVEKGTRRIYLLIRLRYLLQ